MLSKCYGRFMEWWRGYSSPQRNWDTEQVTQVVAVRPKTQVEIAQNILTKYDFCAIHLVEKMFRSSTNTRSYLYEEKVCPKCNQEHHDLMRMRITEEKAIKGIEIKFALDVLKGNSKDSNASSS